MCIRDRNIAVQCQLGQRLYRRDPADVVAFGQLFFAGNAVSGLKKAGLNLLHQLVLKMCIRDRFQSVRFLTTAVASEMSYASGLQRQALFSIALVLFLFILLMNATLNFFLQRNKEG